MYAILKSQQSTPGTAASHVCSQTVERTIHDIAQEYMPLLQCEVLLKK